MFERARAKLVRLLRAVPEFVLVLAVLGTLAVVLRNCMGMTR